MYYLINKVTGIPPTEERMLESRPQAYMEYQKITSPFFPLPPKF
jgi:steroid 5-alpha reductase family enzyme